MVVEIRDWCQNVREYNTYNTWWRGGRGLPSLIALFIMYIRHIFGIVFFWATLYIIVDYYQLSGFGHIMTTITSAGQQH